MKTASKTSGKHARITKPIGAREYVQLTAAPNPAPATVPSGVQTKYRQADAIEISVGIVVRIVKPADPADAQRLLERVCRQLQEDIRETDRTARYDGTGFDLWIDRFEADWKGHKRGKPIATSTKKATEEPGEFFDRYDGVGPADCRSDEIGGAV